MCNFLFWCYILLFSCYILLFSCFPGGSDHKVSPCNAGDQSLTPGSGKFPREENSYPLQYSCLENSMDKGIWQAMVHGLAKSQTWLSNFTSFPGGSDDKESACNAGDLDLIPGLGWYPEEGNSYPLQYSCLENPMDRGAWQATVHKVTESDATEAI